jgi:prepilin-type N-terminal cleavage/methylation domain-containing protein
MRRGGGEGEERRAGAAAGGAAGFTLVEMVVAMALLLLALLLACDLLDESARVLHHSARRAREPWALLAGERLRHDLRGARATGGSGGAWLRLPLVLDVAGEGEVVWSRDGTTLVRTGGGIGRPLLQGVTGFRWRTLGRAVEVEVTLRAPGGWQRPLAPGLPRADVEREERLHCLVVPGAGAAGW